MKDHSALREEWREKFENQSFVRVLKQAQDFNEDQYELLLKLFTTAIKEALAERDKELKNKIIKRRESEDIDDLIKKAWRIARNGLIDEILKLFNK